MYPDYYFWMKRLTLIDKWVSNNDLVQAINSDSLMHGRTDLVIAHRLSYNKNGEDINYVMDKVA